MHIRLQNQLILILFALLTTLAASSAVSAETTAPQMVTIVVDREGDTTAPSGDTCLSAVPNDCTLRWAIEEANQLSAIAVPTITFSSASNISISSSLPVITGDNITINGALQPSKIQSSMVQITNLNRGAAGFRIEGDNVSLSNMRIQSFTGSQVTVEASAERAVLRELTLFGSSCGTTPTDNSTGVYITGYPSVGQSKAKLYGVIAACMGNAGVHMEDTARVTIEREQTSPFGPRNQFSNNRVGMIIDNSCRIFEENSFINDNMEDGVYFTKGNPCANDLQTELILKADQVNDNGDHGVRIESTVNNPFRTTNVSPYEIKGNDMSAIDVNSTILFRPYVLSYDETTNTLNVRVNNTSDNLYLYKMDGDPSQPDGGAEFVRSFELGSSQINFSLPLDDHPEVTAETAVFMLFQRHSLSSVQGKTSQFSEPYTPGAPTAVGLAGQASAHPLGTVVPLLLAAVLLSVVAGLLYRQQRR